MPEDMTLDASAAELAPTRVWDRGGERPVLALHCSLAHSGAWSNLAERLSGVTITAFDQPSHGKAPDWDGREDLHTLTTRLAIDLAERVGQGAPIDMIGHSFGGTVALRIALERPDLVRSLVLVEPVIFAAAHAAEHPAYKPFREHHLEFARLVLQGYREKGAEVFHAAWGTGETLADRLELELVVVTVQLAEDHGGLGGGVFGQVVASDFLAVGLVQDADVGVAHLTEGLLASFGVMDGDGEDQLLHVGAQAGQLDVHLLVIAIALAGTVVAQVLDGTIGGLLVVVEDEAGVVQDFAVFTGDEDRGVQVEFGAIGNARVPAEAYYDFAQARCFFGQADVAALRERYCHGVIP